MNLGENCESPKFTATSYSTKDARLAVEAAAQLEITVKCKNGKQVCDLRLIIYLKRYSLLAKYSLCGY